jgi:phytoene synthase
MSHNVAASYIHCQRVARRSGSSFYYCFLLLPKQQRLAMCALYAFMRHTDDLGDSLRCVEERRGALRAWRHSMLDAIDGRAADDPLLPALADTVRRYDIPLAHLTAAIDGVEMDLDTNRYETFGDLEEYCQRVAAAVGLACLRIWGCNRTEAIGPARRCGVAFQMTNILRDLKEDAARGRVYLPQEDLRRFGYTSDELLGGVCDDRFRRLMHFEIERTERLYVEGQQLERWLPPERLRVFGSMLAMYRTLLAEIKRLEGDVLHYRARVGGWQKVRIAARWLLRPPSRAAAKVGLP